MSERTFVRDFAAATGTTAAAWVRSRRLDEARRLLETTDRPVERIAGECGFGSAVTLRQNFAASFGTSPIAYRRRFDRSEERRVGKERSSERSAPHVKKKEVEIKSTSQ